VHAVEFETGAMSLATAGFSEIQGKVSVRTFPLARFNVLSLFGL